MRRALALLGVVAIVAVGCDGAEDAPEPPPIPTVTPTASPTAVAPASTPSPTVEQSPTTLTAVGDLPSGLFCRDLAAREHPFADAVAYWVQEGQPARMDADLDGVPCETVYPASEVTALVERPTTVEEWIVARNARVLGELPPGTVRPSVVDCDLLGPIGFGSVFACGLQPQTEPGVSFESAGLMVAILDDDGRWATAAGSDVPDATATVLRVYEETGSGLFCRDLASTPYPFSDGFFWAVVYWFLEDRPARMDADLDGIPCETVFPPKEVRRVWKGERLVAR